MSETTLATKKVSRKKPAAKTAEISNLSTDKTPTPDAKDFSVLVEQILEVQKELEVLQKEIKEKKEIWMKEERGHESYLIERNQEEELKRKREEETYDYELNQRRKRAEDEWQEKRQKQEKELAQRKEEIEKDKEELVSLRKQVALFDQERERVVKEAELSLQKSLNEQFANERKLREQETKSEKELSGLKIEGLVKENSRLLSEIALLKKSLEEATGQIKEIAVKVIEAGSTKGKSLPQEE